MSTLWLNGISIAISVVSVSFVAVGSIGYSEEKSVIQSVAWITSANGGLSADFGLRSVYLSSDLLDFEVTQTYRDETCTADFCGICEKNGKSSFVLTIIAIGLTVISMIFGGLAMVITSKALQVINGIVSLFAALGSLVAVGVFMFNCYSAVDQDLGEGPNGLDLQWGPGAILTIIGMLLMWVVVFCQCGAAVGSGGTGTVAVCSDDNVGLRNGKMSTES